MQYDFDEIKSYGAEDIPAAMERLCSEKQFMKVVSTLFPLMPKETLRQKMLSFKSTSDFQKQLVVPFLQYLEGNMTSGIDFNGVENIDLSKKYLFISNHRDIILDSAFLGGKLIENGVDTMEIAIGDNLLVYPWIKDLVRVNKSFIVQRGLTPHGMLESSHRLSAYIRYALTEKHQSVWIAQREGRAKDSDDRTQESLLKMLAMSGNSSLVENLKELNICPLSISYEYDPCDFLKAKEFQQKRDDPNYKKTTRDDLLNMETGVMGYKGKVTYHFSGNINDELDKITQQTKVKNLQAQLVAQLIDKHIHANLKILSNNKIAYDLLTNSSRFADRYSPTDVNSFENYIDKQIRKIDLESKDRYFLRTKILEMYANPLINNMEASIQR
ncbi:MAG: 1-acyl-sn-glycerol-3-phosphate acyltransferase [Paludibacteraceae bacterium]